MGRRCHSARRPAAGGADRASICAALFFSSPARCSAAVGHGLAWPLSHAGPRPFGQRFTKINPSAPTQKIWITNGLRIGGCRGHDHERRQPGERADRHTHVAEEPAHEPCAAGRAADHEQGECEGKRARQVHAVPDVHCGPALAVDSCLVGGFDHRVLDHRRSGRPLWRPPSRDLRSAMRGRVQGPGQRGSVGRCREIGSGRHDPGCADHCGRRDRDSAEDREVASNGEQPLISRLRGLVEIDDHGDHEQREHPLLNTVSPMNFSAWE